MLVKWAQATSNYDADKNYALIMPHAFQLVYWLT